MQVEKKSTALKLLILPLILPHWPWLEMCYPHANASPEKERKKERKKERGGEKERHFDLACFSPTALPDGC